MQMQAIQMPLSGHARVATRDVDQAAEEVGRIFCSHRLQPRDHGRDFFACHNSRIFAGGSINYVAYGGEVEIDPGCLERFFLVQIPLTSGAEVRIGSHLVTTGAARAASVLSPTRPSLMRWKASCGQIILKLERTALEDMFAALTGEGPQDIVFDPQLRLDSEPGRTLGAQILALARLADHALPGDPAGDEALNRLGWSIAHALLWTHAGSARDTLCTAAQHGSGAGRKVARALDYIDAHLGETIDFAALARACGYSLRALQLAFQAERGQTISQALQERRLSLLRQHLMAARGRADGTANITALMQACGLGHPGRAAGAYRDLFGETPAETLRSRRIDAG
ncbi:AraC family transcriptional regulator [Pannonibacter tanglangensis]|uniref:Helix-turn-helix domain-containing protein n=1 Tax=Pannonibacter tanglangensis TaxID=2750084 RepID=A0ABW9ZIY6_9HYPH|nr:AraC family transcriptional regulator [Pannonibacter sp. XCT-34]NBN64389.1 helix-turn-helix domain-containing protein [Pannonibacter sp. XCT-34]